MDASRLISMIYQVKEVARDILSTYIGKPYTEDIVRSLVWEVHDSIECYNSELRAILGIEVYVQIVPIVGETSVQGFVGVRKCESRGLIYE